MKKVWPVFQEKSRSGRLWTEPQGAARKNTGWAEFDHLRNAVWMLMVILLSGSLGSGCAARRHLERAGELQWESGDVTDRDQFFSQLSVPDPDPEGLQARAKGYLTLQQQENHEVSLQVRMQKDRAIWISASSLLNMEVGRILITPDSISIINRLESTFQVQPYGIIHEWLGYELPFASLQQLLGGQFRNTHVLVPLQFFTSGEGHSRFYRQNTAEIIYDTGQRLLLWQIRNFYGEILETQHAYGGSISDPGFPSKTSISFETPRLKLKATLDYTRLERVEEVQIPFSIPKGYRQMH